VSESEFEDSGGLTAPHPSLAAALERAAAALAVSGIEEPHREARILLLAAAKISHADLLLEPDAPLDARAAETLDDYLFRRAAREPVSRIVGVRGFWNVDVAVAPNVLDPRADTETLVELAVRLLRERKEDPLSILDLGTGSGALLCALLSEFPNARGIAVDRCAHACAAAASNFNRCGMSKRAHVVRGDWGGSICESFDLVVSNPPYIETADIESLAPEVRLHDPRLALDGGVDGLDCHRRLAREIPRLLKPGGLAVLEVGAGQAEPARRLLEKNGLTVVATGRDTGGHERGVAVVIDGKRDISATLALLF